MRQKNIRINQLKAKAFLKICKEKYLQVKVNQKKKKHYLNRKLISWKDQYKIIKKKKLNTQLI